MRRKKNESPLEKPKVVTTIAAAAAALGINPRTLKEWFTDPECPREKGRYDVEAIRQWRDATRKPVAPAGARAKWETRKARAEALTRELELRARSGQLIRVDQAAQVIKQHIAEVVTHLDQLPDFAVAGVRLPPDARKRVHGRIKTKVNQLRSTLERSQRSLAKAAARNGGKQIESEDNDASDRPATRSAGRRLASEAGDHARRVVRKKPTAAGRDERLARQV
jgi:hypothetical protein